MDIKESLSVSLDALRTNKLRSALTTLGIVIGVAALILLGVGGIARAIVVALAGAVVIFLADHFVRPKLIGGVTKLPFLWVLLGILGGVERFQLLGLFLGPAIMAAVMLLWREFAAPADDASSSLDPSG